jgi:deoxyuridine 5'-triphosphate nucleotidohydrolase
MFPVTIKFVKTHPDAVLPVYNHADPYIGDSGLDVTAVEDVIIHCRNSTSYGTGTGFSGGPSFKKVLEIRDPWAVVPVGLKLAYITPGYWFRVEGRSGMGFKKHVFPHFGIIDNPYRGDMGIKLYNFSNVDVMIKKGDKIAQLIVYPLIQANVVWSDEVVETKRGEKGFGSSDGGVIPGLKHPIHGVHSGEIMVDGVPTQL